MQQKPFKQGTKITESVLPLMISEYQDDEKLIIKPKKLYGTAFLIGNRGFALTAAHVIDQLHENYNVNNEVINTQILNQDGLYPFKIKEFEKHPTDDIGIIQIDCESLKSILQIDKRPYLSSTQYIGWGFPNETAEELKFLMENPPLKPDLIYIEGYIRRAIHTELSSSIYIGKSFYEVSDVGGACFSGAPIISKNSIGNDFWDVIGVYIGEKEGVGASVGYVVRMEAVADWSPTILGCSISDESFPLVGVATRADL